MLYINWDMSGSGATVVYILVGIEIMKVIQVTKQEKLFILTFSICYLFL